MIDSNSLKTTVAGKGANSHKALRIGVAIGNLKPL